MKNLFLCMCALSLVFISSPARADFSLSELVVDFADGAPRQHDVEIISRDTQEQYIAAEAYEIEHPTETNEIRKEITDPQSGGLLVTPNKLILPASARKLIRFLLLAPQADKDRIYRVVVKPVIKGVEANKQTIALKILVGYEVLVIVRPKDAKIDLAAQRKGTQLTLTNNGNTNAYIKFARQCNATGGDCKQIKVARIYAGQSWTVTLPYMNGTVEAQIWDGHKDQEFTF